MFWKEILITNYTHNHTLDVSFPINYPKRQDVLRLKLEHHEKMSYHMSTVSNLDKISYQAFFVYSSQSTYIQFYHAFLIIKVYIIKRAPLLFSFISTFSSKNDVLCEKTVFFICSNINACHWKYSYRSFLWFKENIMMRQHQTIFDADLNLLGKYLAFFNNSKCYLV